MLYYNRMLLKHYNRMLLMLLIKQVHQKSVLFAASGIL